MKYKFTSNGLSYFKSFFFAKRMQKTFKGYLQKKKTLKNIFISEKNLL